MRTSLRHNNRDIQTTQRSFHQYQLSNLLHLKFGITELLLWLCGILPGLLYALWRLTTKDKICRVCGAPNLIPLGSPKARRALQSFPATTRDELLSPMFASRTSDAVQLFADRFRWGVGISVLFTAWLIVPLVWPVAAIMLFIGFSLIPRVQRWIDSLEIVRRYRLSVGTIWLWFLGVLCLMAAAGAAIGFQFMAVLLLLIAAFCLIPMGWKWLSNEHEFVRQHQKKIRWIVGLSAIFLFALAQPDFGTGSAHSNQTSNERPTSEENHTSYSIVETAALSDSKKSLVVRLDQNVSEDVLRSIATKIKNSDPKQYQRTYIAFYLPGMKIDTGAWATAEFDPNLRVNIIGVTPDQEKALGRLPDDPSREVIGSWWDERPLIRNKMTFFRKNGKVYMENEMADGSGTRVVEIDERLTGRRFFNIPDNGDYWLVNSSGDLEWWDEDGLIFTSRKAD